MLDDGRQFLLDQVVDEVHALFDPIFVAASLYLHHDVEEFVQSSSVVRQDLLQVHVLRCLQPREVDRLDLL